MKRIYLLLALLSFCIITNAQITGANNVCVGSSTTLSATGGGTWSSSNTAVATVGVSSGTVFGVTTGGVNITYTTAPLVFTIAVITVNPLPAAIAGPTSVCVGNTVTLTDATTGGTWSSGGTSIASVGSMTGIVTGISLGATQIDYTLSTGCGVFAFETVSADPGAITSSTDLVCVNSTLALTDGGTGTWTSSATAIATVTPGGGVVSGVSAGGTIITYTLTTGGCYVTMPVTVQPTPAAIGGPLAVCAGSTITLTEGSTGGTWVTGTPTLATVAAGVVTGVSNGLAVISYSYPTGCSATYNVSVNALPASITGLNMVCVGYTIPLNDATGGGTWSCTPTAIATVNGIGVVSGVANGSATVTYKLTSTGCYITDPITVNPTPNPIGGPTVVCQAASITLTESSTGGNWISSNTAVATVDASLGIVTGVSNSVTIISYTYATGCSAMYTVTVNPIPSAIIGVTAICMGTNTTLFDGTSGATWTSGATAIATVDASLGIVTSVSPGVTTITYTLPVTNCFVTQPMSVNPNPVAITGPITDPTRACVNSADTVADATAGGNWSTSSTALATVGTAGDVWGVSAGPVTISYTLATGCYATYDMTVNVGPTSIIGPNAMCIPDTFLFTDGVPGGAWRSSASGSAAVPYPDRGYVKAIAPGVATIFYKIAGCPEVSMAVSVNPTPGPISGVNSLCDGVTAYLYDLSPGGVWSSNDVTIASIDSFTGLAEGVSLGITHLSYTFAATGCYVAVVVTVNPLAPPISGSDTVCLTGNTYLTDIVGGGTWSCSNAAVASIDSNSGLLYGLTNGITYVVYTLPTGCTAALLETVIDSLPPISSPLHICTGSTVALTDAAPGGTWTSSNNFVLSVNDSSGLLAGLLPDTAVITYTTSIPKGCWATKTIAVTPLPTPTVTHTILAATLTTEPYYVAYQWYNADHGLIPGATTATVNLPHLNDSFYVTVTDTNGCSGSSIWYYYDYLGVNNLGMAEVKIFPNPAASIVYISSPVKVRAVISTMDGRMVLQQDDAKQLDINSLADGIYLVALYDENGQIVKMQKLVKE